MLDRSNFIYRLNALINYYYYIYNKFYLFTKDKKIEILLEKNIKLIFDFLDEILKIKEFKSMETNNNYSADNIIIPKKNKKDIYDTKKSENEIYNFINDLFSSSGLKILFIIYFNLYEENELNDLKLFNEYIEQTIDKIYNPFYFYLLLPDISLNNDIKKNNYYKTKILENIINIIIKTNINIKNISNYINNNLALNSIIILIRIYHITQFDPTFITREIENKIINYLDYIFDNFFIYSKIVFDINIIDDNINQMINYNTIEVKFRKNKIKKKYCEYKLILEIALDIIFSLLNNSDNKELSSLINKYLILNGNNSIFFKIDDFYFSNNNNHSFKYNMIILLNSSRIITDYCSGININNALHSIYFLIYFIYKKNFYNSFLNSNKDKEKKINEIISLIDKILEILFNNCINTFKINKKKIKKYKNKIASNEIMDKAYDIILDYFASKYKNNVMDFSEGNEIYKYFTNLLQKKLDDTEKNNEKIFSVSLALRSQSNLNDFSSSSFSRNTSRKGTYMPSESFISEPQSVKIESKLAGFTNIFRKKRDRSSSENTNDDPFFLKHSYNNLNFDINPNKIDEVLSGENSYDNQSLDMNKDSKTDLDVSQSSIPIEKSLHFYEGSNDGSDSDEDNKLKANSNYKIRSNNQVTNSINIIKDKENEKNEPNKINLYLNKKSSNSSENLRHKKLSSDKKSSDEFMLTEVKRGKKRETTKFLPMYFANNININEDINDEHTYLNEKLDKIDIPFSYYKKLNVNKDPKWGRIIFNPKRALFKIFGFVFKNYIFNNRRFNKLKSVFKIKYKNFELEKSIPEEENYSLKYPSKLKNFTCSDYYKPFLKPMLNFFENDYFKNSHSFIINDVFLNDMTEQDKFCTINYEKLEISLNDKSITDMKYKARCENISNKGSIFGVIYFLSSLMIFKDNSNNDERQSKNISELDKLFFLFSSDVSDRLTNLNKYIVLYYSEIKEMILRKYYFNEIAYEIFMKDGRSYFFNFFTKKNREKFYDNFITKINKVNINLKKEKKLELDKIYKFDSNYVNLELIEEPKSFFENSDFRTKYVKNEISNFQYLLLVNKFSSRTYNDCNQYLIFPLLYMDVDKKRERDLSKPICLNKEITELDNIKYINNFETMGYHFNIHYSTMAYVLYYLMRVIPFTFSQIKLQSGHFDAPTRMFTSLENLLFVFKVSDENRELLPEFFYSYESFLNLNYNNFGFTKTNNKQINHFSTSQNRGIVEFIIDLRKILETKELSEWINNIFGSNQLSDNNESFNKFPEYSYEQLNSFLKDKENLYSEIGEDELNEEQKKDINDKISDLKSRIQLLSLGLTPSQLFKSPHPIKEKIRKKSNNKKISLNDSNSINNGNKIKIGNFIKKKRSNFYLINKNVKEYINKTSFNNVLFVFSNNDNDNLKIIFIFEKLITICNFESENGKDIQCKNIELEDELKILDIKPYKNIFVELYENIYLICRLINKTLLLYYGNQKIYIEWPCIITSIEFYSHDEVNSEIHLNKIIIGDEEGTLSLVELETEYNEKKKEFKINTLSYIHKRYKSFYSYINGLLYNKKLNTIISSSNEGIISIINGFSFEILNIIELNNNINILDYKLSEYNLLYIYTCKYIGKESKYNLYCYTLNGIKISELSSKTEYMDYYTDNNGIITINKKGIINEYNCANLKKIESNLNQEDINDLKGAEDIIYCMNSSKLESIFIIFNKNIKTIRFKKDV